MPPQTRAAARLAQTTFAELPLPLALRIFASLPADARLLAAAVCPSWRAMLADPALWTRLDLSSESGVANPSDALLSAAAARAGGQLEFLRTIEQHGGALLAVLAANAGTMRSLVLLTKYGRVCPDPDKVAELLRAAPRLRVLETGVNLADANALSLLRKEPPFGPPLRLKRAQIYDLSSIGWPAVAVGLAAHTSLEAVSFAVAWPELQPESDAVADALLSLPQLRSLSLNHTPASVVARLLGCPTLKTLRVSSRGVPLLDTAASTALLCTALRSNTQIETLKLESVDLWHDMGAATSLLAALQTHPSITELSLSYNKVPPEHAEAAGAAMGSALIAHSAALKTLSILSCDLGDEGLCPIMDALPHARHLQNLEFTSNRFSEAFTRQRMLPAVRACAPLRTLKGGAYPASFQAYKLLEQRR